MLERIICMLVVLGAGVSVVLGHPGPRIWVDVLNGEVVTFSGAYPPGSPSNYRLSRVFTQPLIDEGEDIWDSDFPGYQQVPGGHIPPGKGFSYNIMGPLLCYNPGDSSHYPHFETVQVHFGGSPPVPQMAITNELLQTQYTSSGFVAGNLAFTHNGNAGDHNHLTYTLVGDGINAGGGADGIYALPLQLTTAGNAASNTFHLLLGRNASACELSTAAAVIDPLHTVPDFDCDGHVDQSDLSLFSVCRTGSGIPLPAASPGHLHCPRADLDQDGDVDQSDFGLFQRCYSGSAPADARCRTE